MIPRPGTAAVATGLRRWIEGNDRNVQAAVWLLLAHEVWPARADFRTTCLCHRSDGQLWIDWRAARRAFDAGTFHVRPGRDRAVLDLVIAVGEDRYRLGAMGPDEARLITAAITHAVGGNR